MSTERPGVEVDSDLWHYAVGSERKGPVPQSTMVKLLASGEISTETYVWQPGMDNWVHLGDAPALKGLITSLTGEAEPEPFTEEDTAFASPDTIRAALESDGEDLSGDTIIESIPMEAVTPGRVPTMAFSSVSAAAGAGLFSDKTTLSAPESASAAAPAAGLFSDKTTVTDPSTLAAAPAAAARAGDDLFADVPEADDPFADSAQPAGVHARRQSSVLFNLDDLGRSGGGDRSGSEQFVTESSGLIDIKAIAGSDARPTGPDPFGGSAPNLVIPGTGRGGASPVVIPVVGRRRSMGPWIVAAAVVLVGGGIAVWQLTKSSEPAPAPVPAVVTEVPATPDPKLAEAQAMAAENAKKVEEMAAQVAALTEAQKAAEAKKAAAEANTPPAAGGEPAAAEKPEDSAEPKAASDANKTKPKTAKVEAGVKDEPATPRVVEPRPTTPTPAKSEGESKVNSLLGSLSDDRGKKPDSGGSGNADTSLPQKLSAAAVRAAIRGQFGRCSAMVGSSEGSITVQTQFVISSSGVVQSARITDGGGTSADVQRCVVDGIKSASFGKFQDPTMTVNLPVKLL